MIYTLSSLHPWFITGFVDGEGSFMVSILKNPKVRSGWQIQSVFQIALHKKDIELLKLIQAYFEGIGKIAKHEKDSYSYRVHSLEEILDKLLPNFDKHPLVTQKLADYLLWREIILMMQRNEHLTDEGLQAIVNMRASLNLGVSDELKAAFPNIIPVSKPSVSDYKIQDPHWLVGFTSAEWCFMIRIKNSSTHRLGFQVLLKFSITQQSRYEQLLRSLVTYLNCGGITFHKENQVIEFVVTKFSDIIDKIIPFFVKYSILGVKSKDFADFYKVAEFMKKIEKFRDL